MEEELVTWNNVKKKEEKPREEVKDKKPRASIPMIFEVFSVSHPQDHVQETDIENGDIVEKVQLAIKEEDVEKDLKIVNMKDKMTRANDGFESTYESNFSRKIKRIRKMLRKKIVDALKRKRLQMKGFKEIKLPPKATYSVKEFDL